jgi:hypothetical protein
MRVCSGSLLLENRDSLGREWYLSATSALSQWQEGCAAVQVDIVPRQPQYLSAPHSSPKGADVRQASQPRSSQTPPPVVVISAEWKSVVLDRSRLTRQTSCHAMPAPHAAPLYAVPQERLFCRRSLPLLTLGQFLETVLTPDSCRQSPWFR